MKIIPTLLVIALFGCVKPPEENMSMDKNTEVTTYTESRDLEVAFESLHAYYKINHPQIVSTLRKPAKNEDLAILESVIGQEVPLDFKRLYKLANGQEGTNNPFFQNGYEFMSIAEIIDTWKMMKGLYDGEPDFRIVEDDSGIILDTWWQPGWIPFGYMTSGDHFCVDLSPGKGGVKGQIIEFIHDDSERYHLGRSLTDFIGELDAGLKSGKYFMHSEYEIISSEHES